jgi:hypothetical protein
MAAGGAESTLTRIKKEAIQIRESRFERSVSTAHSRSAKGTNRSESRNRSWATALSTLNTMVFTTGDLRDVRRRTADRGGHVPHIVCRMLSRDISSKTPARSALR